TGADNPLNLTFDQNYNISVYSRDSATQIGGTRLLRSTSGQVSPSNLPPALPE
ncbi:TPA: hypothetical protein HA295_04780, partial [Candidatus Woesearchaeota archaeon]|nr:hypothetical protein [Candidatus Woesearchaeota archaeon]